MPTRSHRLIGGSVPCPRTKVMNDDTETELIPVWKGKLKSNVLNLVQ